MSIRVCRYSIPKRVGAGKDSIQAGMLLANMAVSRLQNTLDLTDVMLKSLFPLTASTAGCRTIIVRALGYAFAQMMPFFGQLT